MDRDTDLITRRYDEIEYYLKSHNEWMDTIEWSMGLETLVTISKTTTFVRTNEVWYEVRVKFRHEFFCVCPTVKRAVEFANIYVNTIMDLLEQHGWPAVENQEA